MWSKLCPQIINSFLSSFSLGLINILTEVAQFKSLPVAVALFRATLIQKLLSGYSILWVFTSLHASKCVLAPGRLDLKLSDVVAMTVWIWAMFSRDVWNWAIFSRDVIETNRTPAIVGIFVTHRSFDDCNDLSVESRVSRFTAHFQCTALLRSQSLSFLKGSLSMRCRNLSAARR